MIHRFFAPKKVFPASQCCRFLRLLCLFLVTGVCHTKRACSCSIMQTHFMKLPPQFLFSCQYRNLSLHAPIIQLYSKNWQIQQLSELILGLYVVFSLTAKLLWFIFIYLFIYFSSVQNVAFKLNWVATFLSMLCVMFYWKLKFPAIFKYMNDSLKGK